MKPQQQDKKKFSALIQKNQALIHKVTLVYANSPADRDDLFQEICLRLWKSYADFREESQFCTWMYRVALNTAISTVRKRKNSPAVHTLEVEKLLAAEPSTNTGDIEGVASNRLHSVFRYLESGECGAARYELRLLTRGLTSKPAGRPLRRRIRHQF